MRPARRMRSMGFRLHACPIHAGVGKLFPHNQGQLYLGAEAREETVKSEKLDEFRYIHFATHGFLDELHPGRSGTLLSRSPESKEDGMLQTGDIMRLKINADIVTLSAYSTGLGKIVNGKGVLGFSTSELSSRASSCYLWKRFFFRAVARALLIESFSSSADMSEKALRTSLTVR